MMVPIIGIAVLTPVAIVMFILAVREMNITHRTEESATFQEVES